MFDVFLLYERNWCRCEMLDYIGYLNIPEKALLVLVSIFFVMQIIGELLEFKGKVVPEFFKIRKPSKETIDALAHLDLPSGVEIQIKK